MIYISFLSVHVDVVLLADGRVTSHEDISADSFPLSGSLHGCDR